MDQYHKDEGATADSRAVFPKTNWMLISAASRADNPEGWKALENLCSLYWYPLYAVARRCGHPPANAKDFVQGFFVHFLSKSSRLAAADPEKGSFRGFLKTCLRHYIINRKDFDKRRVQGQAVVSVDSLAGELKYSVEPQEADGMELFDLGWARETFRTAVESILLESRDGLHGKDAEKLIPFLTGRGIPASMPEFAKEMGIQDGALRVRISRLRKRLGEILFQIVSLQVGNQRDCLEEFRYLFAVLARYYEAGRETKSSGSAAIG